MVMEMVASDIVTNPTTEWPMTFFVTKVENETHHTQTILYHHLAVAVVPQISKCKKVALHARNQQCPAVKFKIRAKFMSLDHDDDDEVRTINQSKKRRVNERHWTLLIVFRSAFISDCFVRSSYDTSITTTNKKHTQVFSFFYCVLYKKMTSLSRSSQKKNNDDDDKLKKTKIKNSQVATTTANNTDTADSRLNPVVMALVAFIVLVAIVLSDRILAANDHHHGSSPGATGAAERSNAADFFSSASSRRLIQHQNTIHVFITANSNKDSNDPIGLKLQQDLKVVLNNEDRFQLIVHALTLEQQESFLEASSCGQDALDRFQELVQRQQEHLAAEVWKYCALRENGGVFIDSSSPLLVRLHDVLESVGSSTGTGSTAGSSSSSRSVAVLSEEYFPKTIHSSLLILQPNQKHIAASMLQVLVDTSLETLEFHQLFLPRTLYELISSDANAKTATEAESLVLGDNGPNWIIYETKCHVDPLRRQQQDGGGDATTIGWTDSSTSFRYSHACPVHAGFCCTVQDDTHKTVMISRHPILPFQKVSNRLPLPYNAEAGHYNEAELPYISTIKERVYERPVVTTTNSKNKGGEEQSNATPNFFDLLLANNCLPDDVNCSKCLRDKSGSDCVKCAKPCGCYCETLCKVKPAAKFVAKDITISPPLYSRDPNRLVPRIIHQTYFEELTQEKYPNMSRLINSFKSSGWEYRFYTDEDAQNFLSTHFPAEVRQAYDTLRPGAFKADLFRYCALLIHGGLYVDVDIMLESFLDNSIPANVGFLTPMDEPGVGVNRRFCVWNGLIASAPGHPFLAKAIETVVNQVRNRFTSVDVDARFCPSQEMSILHSFDMLFTAGPCLLGSAINFSLGREGQRRFVPGELVPKEMDEYEKASSFVIGAEEPLSRIPGRTIILHQEKWDMGSHRFTFVEKNLVVAATDLEDSDDRANQAATSGKKTEHYSKTHAATGIYGLEGLYTDRKSANEDVRFLVDLSMQTKIKSAASASVAVVS
jgi:mannosyltransferase OCH1-like enzyme